MKRFIIALAAAALFGPAAAEASPLKVVATTTTFAEIVRRIGGDRVEVKSIASPKFNIHFIQPRPSDVRKTANADLFVHGGLDLEAWVDPLLQAAGKPALFRGAPRNLDLSEGVRLLKIPDHHHTRAEGDIHLFGNPHYQMSPENARHAAGLIEAKLAELDPSNASAFAARRAEFERQMDAKIAEWKSLCASCVGKEVISFHDDFAYLADFLGLHSEKFLEPKPGVPPSPKHLAELEAYAREKGVRAIVLPSYYERGTADAFARRIGASVVLVGQNAGELPKTDMLEDFYATNVRSIAEALK